MGSEHVNVRGLHEVMKYLDKVPDKIAARHLRSVMRAGATALLKIARARVAKRSGNTAKSGRVKRRRRGVSFGQEVFHVVFRGAANLLEHGAAPHKIISRKKGEGFLRFAGRWLRKVSHPGFNPKPFLRPTLDHYYMSAVVAMAKQMLKRIKRDQSLGFKVVA